MSFARATVFIVVIAFAAGVGTGTADAQARVDWEGFAVKGFEMTAELQDLLPTHLNCAYGPHPKQQMDLYFPKSRPTDAPVFVFVHGGGFERGDRRRYGWVARSFAAHGVITVVPSYRLAPEFSYPSQPDDIRHVVAWVYHNIGAYGGNPKRVFIGGHSAGAILTSLIGLKTDWLAKMSLPADLIKGVIAVSAGYDLRTDPAAKPEDSLQRARSFYLPDASRQTEASPLLNVMTPPPDTIVATGSVEAYTPASRALVDKIREKGGRAELILLEGMNHADTVLALADEKSPLFQAAIRIIQLGSGKPSAP